MTEQADPTSPTSSSGRIAELRKAADGLRTRLRSLDLERVLLMVGSVLVPTGLVAILLGWYGIAHTPFLFEQLSYVVSGGLFGIALVLSGGFSYLGAWVLRQDARARHEGADTRALLGRIAQLLEVGAERSTSAGRPDRWGTPLVATAKGSMVHRPDCPVIASRGGVRNVDGSEAGLQACKLCDPLPTQRVADA